VPALPKCRCTPLIGRTHIQLLGGLILYFISPYVKFEGGVMKDAVARFYTVEHISMMLIAVALITIGYSKAKRAANSAAKGKTTFWFYLIGLLVILAAIPWPFRSGLGGGWY
jgi:membrane protein DedA with SNARE-associated domain